MNCIYPYYTQNIGSRRLSTNGFILLSSLLQHRLLSWMGTNISNEDTCDLPHFQLFSLTPWSWRHNVFRKFCHCLPDYPVLYLKILKWYFTFL